MAGELIVLRIIHLLGGMFWAGALVYMAVFLMPALATAGPAAGAVMSELERRKVFTVLPVVALLTILSGLRLLQLASRGSPADFFATLMGQLYVVAGIAAVLAFVIGVAVSRPAMLRAGRLMAQRESVAPEARLGIDVEVAALRARGGAALRMVTALVVLSALLMSVVRYL